MFFIFSTEIISLGFLAIALTALLIWILITPIGAIVGIVLLLILWTIVSEGRKHRSDQVGE